MDRVLLLAADETVLGRDEEARAVEARAHHVADRLLVAADDGEPHQRVVELELAALSDFHCPLLDAFGSRLLSLPVCVPNATSLR
jgi:hypothetical protein